MRTFISIQILLLLCCTQVSGQPKPFFWGNDTNQVTVEKNNFQTIIFGTQNGLPSSEITALAQDTKGYIWIGTSAGLSRYDGLKFENFLKADNVFTGKIYAIREDSIRNLIWIACEGGLCFFKNNELHRVRCSEADVTFYEIYFQGDKTMWVGTGYGPAFFSEQVISDALSGKEISLNSLLLTQWKKLYNLNSPAYKIIGTVSGSIYFAGGSGVFFYDKKELEKIWTSQHQQDNNDNIVGMVHGKDDSIYFASVFSGLFAVINNKVTRVLEDNYIAAEMIEHNGDIYYFTMSGIFKFLPAFKNLQVTSKVPLALNIWPSCLLVDNENNFWIGMHDNLVYQKPRIFYNYKNESQGAEIELYSVLRLKNNELYFGSNKGMLYKKEGENFENIFRKKRVVPNAEIKSIYEDTRGWLWLGTGYQGIAIMKDNELLHFTKNDGLSTNSNYFFYEDASGNIYTGGDRGISKITVDSLSNHLRFTNYFFDVAGENIETFKNCVAGPDASLWFGGQKGVFHLAHDSLIHYALSKKFNISVTDIKKDHEGYVWLATRGDGIWQCFFDAGNLLQLKKIYSNKDGLQSNIYLDIAVDHENNLWAGSYLGITSFRKKGSSYTINNYTSNDGFLSSNYQALKLYCDVNDTVWVTTSAGLSSFSTGFPNAESKILLNFTSVVLRDTSEKISRFIKNENESIAELPYYLNGLEFRYKAICLSDPQKIKYTYRLLGSADTSWLEWENKEFVLYQNLSPGSYVFEVKASLDNNATDPIKFPFIIKSPFWVSGWFLVSVILSAILIVYVLQKKMKKSMQVKHNEKIRTQKLISENLQYQLEVEQVTNYFTTSMSTRETVDDLLWDVARQCISKLNFEDCVIYLKDEKSGMLLQKAAWGPKSNSDELKNGQNGKIISPIEIPIGKGIVGSVAATGMPEIIADVTRDARYIKDDEQRWSEIAVPVIYNSEVLGVIDSESKQKDFYSKRHLKILTTIASHCAERIVKLRADENLHQNQLELLQAQNRLAEEKLTALRSQMNPHFIFNCLNSIQQFILTGDVDNANKYLSQFSKLIRLVLQYSENNFISLEEEINMLELYLSLEKTRFGNSFEYKILIDHELDTDEIKIPNLMVQPFVENAIWHGLMHKPGDRKININFQLKNEQFILCEVTDNGIGRTRAAEIKEMKSVELKHKSRGMQLIKDKIEILRQQFKSEVLIEISDVLSNTGEICGTRVLIQLPLQYQDE